VIGADKEKLDNDTRFDLRYCAPFLAVHLACLMLFFVGFSWIALFICLLMYVVRMFGITAGYHRYFSHRSFKTSRPFQFLLGFLGASSAQMGPLWWVAHHRNHHAKSDTEDDVHSPTLQGIWWAHVGWLMSKRYAAVGYGRVRDLIKYPEIRLLDKYHLIAPLTLAISIYLLGAYLGANYPTLNTSGPQLLAWGFFLSTVLVYHGTFSINSLAHLIGTKRYDTGDNSRNSLLLSIVTLGEGWHNNHHRFPSSERQGFYWWEFDPTHYVLKILSYFGLVWDLQTPPQHAYETDS